MPASRSRRQSRVGSARRSAGEVAVGAGWRRRRRLGRPRRRNHRPGTSAALGAALGAAVASDAAAPSVAGAGRLWLRRSRRPAAAAAPGLSSAPGLPTLGGPGSRSASAPASSSEVPSAATSAAALAAPSAPGSARSRRRRRRGCGGWRRAVPPATGSGGAAAASAAPSEAAPAARSALASSAPWSDRTSSASTSAPAAQRGRLPGVTVGEGSAAPTARDRRADGTGIGSAGGSGIGSADGTGIGSADGTGIGSADGTESAAPTAWDRQRRRHRNRSADGTDRQRRRHGIGSAQARDRQRRRHRNRQRRRHRDRRRRHWDRQRRRLWIGSADGTGIAARRQRSALCRRHRAGLARPSARALARVRRRTLIDRVVLLKRVAILVVGELRNAAHRLVPIRRSSSPRSSCTAAAARFHIRCTPTRRGSAAAGRLRRCEHRARVATRALCDEPVLVHVVGMIDGTDVGVGEVIDVIGRSGSPPLSTGRSSTSAAARRRHCRGSRRTSTLVARCTCRCGYAPVAAGPS